MAKRKNNVVVPNTTTFKLVGPQEDDVSMEEVTKKSPALFDFITSMFANKKEFLEKSNYDKGVYGFMINRFMAIKAPKVAAQFSKIGINQGNVVTSWVLMFFKLTRTPDWMYVSTAKNKEEKRKKEFDVKISTIETYCKMHEIDMKTFNEAKERYPIEFLQELQNLERMIEM